MLFFKDLIQEAMFNVVIMTPVVDFGLFFFWDICLVFLTSGGDLEGEEIKLDKFLKFFKICCKCINPGAYE